MPSPTTPYQPYASVHVSPKGVGDARPTAFQIIQDNSTNLSGKTILITGCSAGLGIATAAALYAAGATLFLTGRDMTKLDQVIDDMVTNPLAPTSAPRPRAIEMHLDSLASVKKGSHEILKKIEKLNIAIFNAGVMAIPTLTYTTDKLEMQIGVNHFSHFLLFQLLQPLLSESAKESGTTSRVVALSSSGHWFNPIRSRDMHWRSQPVTYQKWQSYGQSKTANIYMANSIHRHYASQGITALSVHPGGIQTSLGRNLEPSDYADFATDSQDVAVYFKSPEQGAATSVWAAVSPHFENVANGGRYLADVGECGPKEDKPKNPAASGYETWAYDEEKEEKLWEVSLETVKGFM